MRVDSLADFPEGAANVCAKGGQGGAGLLWGGEEGGGEGGYQSEEGVEGGMGAGKRDLAADAGYEVCEEEGVAVAAEVEDVAGHFGDGFDGA